MTKNRSIKAATKSHTIQKYEDTRQNRVATLQVTKTIMNQKRKASGGGGIHKEGRAELSSVDEGRWGALSFPCSRPPIPLPCHHAG